MHKDTADMKPKKRFGIVKKLIVLAIALALFAGTIAWLAYRAVTPHYVAAADSSGTFTYEYPDTWQAEPHVWSPCCHGLTEEQLKEPDWSKQSQPITLHPKGVENAELTIRMEDYGAYWESFESIRADAKEDFFAKILFDGVRDDGHRALFSRVDYLGPPDAKVESYTDHRYYFDNGKSVLRIDFREKYHHDWPDEGLKHNVDNSRYVADFKHIAKSIKFTN